MTATPPASPGSASPSGEPSPGTPGARPPARSAAPIPRDQRVTISASTGSPFPSAATLALARASRSELERAIQRGGTPDTGALAGWEMRGINATPLGAPPIARLLGIEKFIKGFYREADGAGERRVMGYNTPVVQNVLDGRWRARPSDAEPRRFGFFEVAPVDPTARDNEYLHALLLDYGKGGNPVHDPSRGLRDYLVQLDDDRWLGKAYYALGPIRVAVGYFLLERFRPGPAELPPRR